MYYLITFKTYGLTRKAVKTFSELQKQCEMCNGAYTGSYRSSKEMILHLFENVQSIKKTKSWNVANKFIFE